MRTACALPAPQNQPPAALWGGSGPRGRLSVRPAAVWDAGGGQTPLLLQFKRFGGFGPGGPRSPSAPRLLLLAISTDLSPPGEQLLSAGDTPKEGRVWGPQIKQEQPQGTTPSPPRGQPRAPVPNPKTGPSPSSPDPPAHPEGLRPAVSPHQPNDPVGFQPHAVPPSTRPPPLFLQHVPSAPTCARERRQAPNPGCHHPPSTPRVLFCPFSPLPQTGGVPQHPRHLRPWELGG